MDKKVVKKWKAYQLCELLDNAMWSEYEVLFCADCDYPGTNWTDKFSVDIDHDQRVIRLWADVA